MINTDELKLVKNEKKYWSFIRKLRNEKSYANNFGDQHCIKKSEHELYMKKYGDDYYVCLYKNKPVGWVGKVCNDIRICTHKDYQRVGIGIFMLKNFIKVTNNINECYAKIKLHNMDSLKLFLNSGFTITNYYLEYKNEK